jgi:hypothetical protein
MLQQPLNSRDGFRPGTGFNLNAGFRYVGMEHVIPSIQVNARIEGRESGPNADVDNSGASLVYLSPGVNFQVVDNLHAYVYAQVPIYQRQRLADRVSVYGHRRHLLHDVTVQGDATANARRSGKRYSSALSQWRGLSA